MGKKMTVFTFDVTLDGWKLTQLESRGKDADSAKAKMRKKWGTRITAIKLVRWFDPNVAQPYL